VHAAILRTLGEIGYDELLMRADELAKRAGDEHGRAFGLLLLGQLHLTTDRPATALETLKRALALFEQHHDERGRGRVFYQLARVYRMFADLNRAEQAVERAGQIASTSSDRGLSARCGYLQGDLAMRRRRFQKAERLLREAAGLLEASGDRTTLVYAWIDLALVKSARHNRKADPEAGAGFANRAVALARELGMPRQESLAYAALVFAYLAAGRPRFAHAVSRKALRYMEERRSGRRRAAEVLFIHYRCLKALGRMDQAPEFLKRAVELVQEQARAIENDRYRKSFVERDLFNVAVLREAGKVLGG
jgi:tetratricopeptide (TPR) repeat protein